jgi:WD40 repeat protein
MSFQPLIETPAFVISYAIQEKIYLLSGNCLQAYASQTGEKLMENRLFGKEGLARSFTVDERYIYVIDFIDLYILHKDSLALQAKLQLGTDLSSDICGRILSDDRYVYAAIRNGAIARIEKGAWENVQFFPVSSSSSWAMTRRDDRIYAGNVDGQLLVIDTGDMRVQSCLPAHKQNIKSVKLLGPVLATASHDKSLALWDVQSLECLKVKKNLHKKAFSIIGTWRDYLLTVSFPCGEIKVWNAESLQEVQVIPVGRCLLGQVVIISDKLYLSSRVVNGIEWLDLTNTIANR